MKKSSKITKKVFYIKNIDMQLNDEQLKECLEISKDEFMDIAKISNRKKLF